MENEPARPEPPDAGARSAEELTRRNVERIQALEREEHGKATTADRVADTVASFVGSITFVWVTVLLIGGGSSAISSLRMTGSIRFPSRCSPSSSRSRRSSSRSSS